MRTVTYTSVLQKAVELTGRVYPPTIEEASFFRSYIETALRKIWEKFPWPETIAVQKEYFGIFPDPSTSYINGNVLFNAYDKKYYQAIPSSGITTGEIGITDADGNVVEAGWYVEVDGGLEYEEWDATLSYDSGTIVWFPLLNKYYAVRTSPSIAGYGPDSTLAEMWGEVFVFNREIDKLLNPDGTDRSQKLGEILRITTEDPRSSKYLTDVNYDFLGDKIRVFDSIPYCWVEYRTTPTEFNGEDPETIPYRFSEYVSQRAASVMLAKDGKLDSAAAMAGMAEETLIEECDKVNSQEGQVRQIIVGTR